MKGPFLTWYRVKLKHALSFDVSRVPVTPEAPISRPTLWRTAPKTPKGAALGWPESPEAGAELPNTFKEMYWFPDLAKSLKNEPVDGLALELLSLNCLSDSLKLDSVLLIIVSYTNGNRCFLLAFWSTDCIATRFMVKVNLQ
jgi:hypothetical protein